MVGREDAGVLTSLEKGTGDGAGAGLGILCRSYQWGRQGRSSRERWES